MAALLPSAESTWCSGECHNHSIIFIAEIRWYQMCNKSKSLPVASETRGKIAGESACDWSELKGSGCQPCEGLSLWESQFNSLPFAGEKEPSKIVYGSEIWVEGRKIVRRFSFQSVSLTQLLPSFDICAWTEEDVVSILC